MRHALAAIVLTGALLFARPAIASSASELVRIAHAHELAHEDDIALRRYMEALSLDPTCEEAYLGLGDLRARRGDLREAERVYSTLLEHFPQNRTARVARAQIRRALGATALARTDLLVGFEDDVGVLRTIAGWYGEDGSAPAQLATWRRIGAIADAGGDTALVREARTMVRALVILVGPADPVAAPAPDGIRHLLSVLARRGGF